MGHERSGPTAALLIVPLSNQQRRQEYPAQRAPEARQAAGRHPHCHSVYLTFHLGEGNRTSALLCVCEDNRGSAYPRSLSVRDGSLHSQVTVQVQERRPPAAALLRQFWIPIKRGVNIGVFRFDDA